MDISMPECDGIEGVKLLKKISPKAIVIMISALGQKDLVLQAIKLGANDFIVKPFEEANVIDTLKRLSK